MTDPFDPVVLAEGDRLLADLDEADVWEVFDWLGAHGLALLAVARDHARLTAENERLRDDLAHARAKAANARSDADALVKEISRYIQRKVGR